MTYAAANLQSYAREKLVRPWHSIAKGQTQNQRNTPKSYFSLAPLFQPRRTLEEREFGCISTSGRNIIRRGAYNPLPCLTTSPAMREIDRLAIKSPLVSVLRGTHHDPWRQFQVLFAKPPYVVERCALRSLRNRGMVRNAVGVSEPLFCPAMISAPAMLPDDRANSDSIKTVHVIDFAGV